MTDNVLALREALEPCPFCGGRPVTACLNDDGDRWVVRCISCGAEGGWGKTATSAERYWSMRTPAAVRAETLAGSVVVEVLEAFMVAFEDTGVHEHERDDNSIDLCIPIAPLKPVYWAACAACGHRWTVVDVEPFCERCGFREGDDEDDATITAVVQSAELHPGDCAAVEEAGSSPARGAATPPTPALTAARLADGARHWTLWEAEATDGWTILDPDGFRHGKPTEVTKEEFERARLECALIRDESRGQYGLPPRSPREATR